MVKVTERQYVISPIEEQHIQDRVAEYDSWEDYVGRLLRYDGFVDYCYPPVPRRTQLISYEITDNYVDGCFYNRSLGRIVRHFAVLQEKDGVPVL